MKNWMNRFALLAVLGAVIGSAVVVGCGAGTTEGEGSDAEANATANSPSAKEDSAETP